MQEQENIISNFKKVANEDPALTVQPEIARKERRKKFWIWSIIIIAAVSAGAAILVQMINQENFSWDFTTFSKLKRSQVNDTLPEGYKFQAVAANKFPKDLPISLVMYKDAEPLRGEVTTTADGQKHVVTEFVVTDKPETVIQKYVDYLTGYQWKEIAKKFDPQASFFNGTKNGQSLMITAILSKEGSQVSLDYQPKQ